MSLKPYDDFKNYCKSSVKPPSPGEGAYSQNQMIRIYVIAFQLLYPIFCGFNIQRVKDKFDTFTIVNTSKTNIQARAAKYMERHW